jgi:hypothetical protein
MADTTLSPAVVGVLTSLVNRVCDARSRKDACDLEDRAVTFSQSLLVMLSFVNAETVAALDRWDC